MHLIPKRKEYGIALRCSSEKAYRFGRTNHLYLQGRRVCQAARRLLLLLGLLSDPEKEVVCSYETSGCLYKKRSHNPETVLFIVSTVRNSNPAYTYACFAKVTEFLSTKHCTSSTWLAISDNFYVKFRLIRTHWEQSNLP
jgi:hypothetical protein